MKDIGYYAGFLSTEDQQKVNDAPISNLAAAIIVLSYYIYQEHDHTENSVLDIPPPQIRTRPTCIGSSALRSHRTQTHGGGEVNGQL